MTNVISFYATCYRHIHSVLEENILDFQNMDTYVYMYVYIYICVYIYIHTYTLYTYICLHILYIWSTTASTDSFHRLVFYVCFIIKDWFPWVACRFPPLPISRKQRACLDFQIWLIRVIRYIYIYIHTYVYITYIYIHNIT